MGVVIDVIDEFRTGSTVVILEHNRADELGGYTVKTRRKYKTAAAARAAYEKELPKRKTTKKTKGK